MSYDEMAEEREILIGQGVDMPNMDSEYYDHDDKFDAFSCVTGDYRASQYADSDDTITIKVESDIESHIDSDTDTLCSGMDLSSRNEFSTASTPSTNISQLINGNVRVIMNNVGVNDEHEGMNYDLLADGPESYEYHESIIQNGNSYP